ncbi:MULTISPECIES: cytochrome P450 [Kribbella]|jgi:cytochrome P450|uniref:Cytochrome P450 n=1 Tax=Kribbella pratensis TaxID=2512112 RepID=A0ABY2F9J1_9ACTN|nr:MULTISPECIES: cytochrome P450 [Kribbella]TDW87247.1 cytochrome P450 [Kribbella pratensis]TDW91430.1 cytochrome P450 [Kribbella sp. VKM Ac-2566]
MRQPFTEVSGIARHWGFEDLASTGPVQRLTLFTGVPVQLVTGYAETRELLAHPDVVRSPLDGPHRDSVMDDLIARTEQHMLGANPPDHTRLRKLVAAAFTRRRIEALEPRIREIATGLLDEMAAADEPVDLVNAYSYPLPITVICELIGIPAVRRDDFRRWSSVFVNAAVYTAEEYIEAITSMLAFVHELIVQKQQAPTDDLLSALIATRDGSDRLSEDELTSMVFLLLAAGHETTVSLITNGVHALLRHPDQLELLKREPERLPTAVEELLRYDGPLQAAIPYVARAPIDIAGRRIEAGEVIVFALLPANRDVRKVERADELDITRTDTAHLAFGHGIHHCLGAPLARLEGRIALGLLFERFPRLRLAVPEQDPPRHPSLLMNAIRELPVLL